MLLRNARPRGAGVPRLSTLATMYPCCVSIRYQRYSCTGPRIIDRLSGRFGINVKEDRVLFRRVEIRAASSSSRRAKCRRRRRRGKTPAGLFEAIDLCLQGRVGDDVPGDRLVGQPQQVDPWRLAKRRRTLDRPLAVGRNVVIVPARKLCWRDTLVGAAAVEPRAVEVSLCRILGRRVCSRANRRPRRRTECSSRRNSPFVSGRMSRPSAETEYGTTPTVAFADPQKAFAAIQPLHFRQRQVDPRVVLFGKYRAACSRSWRRRSALAACSAGG